MKPVLPSMLLIVASAMILFPTSVVKRADAVDIKQAAGTAGMLGTVILATSGHDIVKSTTNCYKNITTLSAQQAACDGPQALATCGELTTAHTTQITNDIGDGAVSGSCGLVALNVAAMGAALVPMLSSDDAGNAVTGVNGNTQSLKSFDPTKPIVDQIKCGDDKCGCTAADAASNPVCSPAALQNLPGEVAKFKAGLADGSLKPANGQTLEDALAGADAAMATASKLSEGLVPPSGNVTATDFTGDPTSAKGSGAGKGYSVIESNGGGGAGGSDFGSGKTLAGPADRAGLGATLWNGKLDMIDDVTGRSLTLWQRATRRYQGEVGKRAFMLARIEGLRRNQFLKMKPVAKPVIAQAGTPAAAKITVKTAVKAVVVAPHAGVGRKPASVGRAP